MNKITQLQTRQTIIEMMKDRNYNTIFEKNIEPFTTPILVASNEIEECYIFFCSDVKLGVQEFRKFQGILQVNNIHHCIIISKLGATSFTSAVLQKIDSEDMEIELFP